MVYQLVAFYIYIYLLKFAAKTEDCKFALLDIARDLLCLCVAPGLHSLKHSSSRAIVFVNPQANNPIAIIHELTVNQV